MTSVAQGEILASPKQSQQDQQDRIKGEQRLPPGDPAGQIAEQEQDGDHDAVAGGDRVQTALPGFRQWPPLAAEQPIHKEQAGKDAGENQAGS